MVGHGDIESERRAAIRALGSVGPSSLPAPATGRQSLGQQRRFTNSQERQTWRCKGLPRRSPVCTHVIECAGGRDAVTRPSLPLLPHHEMVAVAGFRAREARPHRVPESAVGLHDCVLSAVRGLGELARACLLPADACGPIISSYPPSQTLAPRALVRGPAPFTRRLSGALSVSAVACGEVTKSEGTARLSPAWKSGACDLLPPCTVS